MRFLSEQGPVAGSKTLGTVDSHFKETLTPDPCGEQLSWVAEGTSARSHGLEGSFMDKVLPTGTPPSQDRLPH